MPPLEDLSPSRIAFPWISSRGERQARRSDGASAASGPLAPCADESGPVSPACRQPAATAPKAALRSKLADAGYSDVATVLQSGNVIVSIESDRPDVVADAMQRLLSDEFDVNVPCVVRTENQVWGVFERDPLQDVVSDPLVCVPRKAIRRRRHGAQLEHPGKDRCQVLIAGGWA